LKSHSAISSQRCGLLANAIDNIFVGMQASLSATPAED
jgi:hypothetical protein